MSMHCAVVSALRRALRFTLLLWLVLVACRASSNAGTTLFQIDASDSTRLASNGIALNRSPINGKSALRLFVTQVAGSLNDHPIGVSYQTESKQWVLYNEDLGQMPDGALFNVLATTSGAKVVASGANSYDNRTFFQTAKQKPAALLLFGHLYNPSLKLNGGILLSNQQGIGYKADVTLQTPANGRWFIANEDLGPALAAAYFVMDATRLPNAFSHTSLMNNISGSQTLLDNPATNGKPDAVILISRVYGSGDTKALGVTYEAPQWRIIHEDGSAFPVGESFNVVAYASATP